MRSKLRSPASTCATRGPASIRVARIFDGGKGAGDRGVHVADDDDQIRLMRKQFLLEAFEHARRLRAVASRADTQRDVRVGKPQVAEEAAASRSS